MFSEKAEGAIPAEFRMISGCEDRQTSADVSNVASFRLPDPAGECKDTIQRWHIGILSKFKI